MVARVLIRRRRICGTFRKGKKSMRTIIRPVGAIAIAVAISVVAPLSTQADEAASQIPNLEHYQVIIFLSKEAKEEIRRLPAKAVTMQWLTPDPSKVTGSDEEIRDAYTRTFTYLDSNIRDFVQAVLGNGI